MSMMWLGKQVRGDELEVILRDPARLSGILDAAVGEDLPGVLQLDKAWNGVHWLLAMDQEPRDTPESKLIYGGAEVGEDMGYGPARYLGPAEVRAAAEGIAKVTREEFTRRYDPKAMDEAGVYPQVWLDDPQEGLTWLLESLDHLSAFVRDAAAKGNALLTFVY